MISEQTQASASGSSDNNTSLIFDIVDGCLWEYKGEGPFASVPEGVTKIANNAFWGCESLTSIALPDSITSIGERTFYGCTSLMSVSIPKHTKIGDKIFENCPAKVERRK
jgi:hypothetical protein